MTDHKQHYSGHKRRHRHHWQDAELAAETCGTEAFANAVHAQARQDVAEYNRTHKPCDTCTDPTCGGLSCKGTKTGMLAKDDAPAPGPSARTRHKHGSPGATSVQLSDVPWIAHSYREAPASGNSTGV